MKIWNIVHDCDGENREPTCLAKEINHAKYGRFAWISKNTDGNFDVTAGMGTLATCKSLTIAKRWVSMKLTQPCSPPGGVAPGGEAITSFLKQATGCYLPPAQF